MTIFPVCVKGSLAIFGRLGVFLRKFFAKSKTFRVRRGAKPEDRRFRRMKFLAKKEANLTAGQVGEVARGGGLGREGESGEPEAEPEANLGTESGESGRASAQNRRRECGGSEEGKEGKPRNFRKK